MCAQPPNINFKRKDKGGISMSTTVKLKYLDLDTVTTVLKEYRVNALPLIDSRQVSEWVSA